MGPSAIGPLSRAPLPLAYGCACACAKDVGISIDYDYAYASTWQPARVGCRCSPAGVCAPEPANHGNVIDHQKLSPWLPPIVTTPQPIVVTKIATTTGSVPRLARRLQVHLAAAKRIWGA